MVAVVGAVVDGGVWWWCVVWWMVVGGGSVGTPTVVTRGYPSRFQPDRVRLREK